MELKKILFIFCNESWKSLCNFRNRVPSAATLQLPSHHTSNGVSRLYIEQAPD
jgi:hypothetical protein